MKSCKELLGLVPQSGEVPKKAVSPQLKPPGTILEKLPILPLAAELPRTLSNPLPS